MLLHQMLIMLVIMLLSGIATQGGSFTETRAAGGVQAGSPEPVMACNHAGMLCIASS